MIAAIYALVLALVLAIASHAWAACAWVLWTEVTEAGTGVTKNTTWEWGREVHDSRVACERAIPVHMHRQVRAYAALGLTVVGPGDDPVPSGPFVRSGHVLSRVTAGQREEPAWLLEHEFHCLPDTIDPRGPKGGGR